MKRQFRHWQTAIVGLMVLAFLAVSMPVLAQSCCPAPVDNSDCKKDCKQHCKLGDTCDKKHCCEATVNGAGVKSSGTTVQASGANAGAACCPDKSDKCCPQGSSKCCPTGDTGGVSTKAPQQKVQAKKSKTT